MLCKVTISLSLTHLGPRVRLNLKLMKNYLVMRLAHGPIASARYMTGMRQDDVNGMDADKCIGICHNNGSAISA